MNTALLLIDIQNDYFPGGKMELEGSIEASEKAKQILTYFREKKLPVIHIQHISVRPGASFFIPGTEGAEIQCNVKPMAGEIIVQKNFPNSFRNTNLLQELKSKDVNSIIICGMMTHMCVDATTRAAFDFGFDCIVLHDACATKALSFNNKIIPAEYVHTTFMAALSGVYAKIIATNEFISIP